jgi:peptidyl-tRNA hydrolase
MAAQAVHAAFEFSVHHPDLVRQWNVESNFLVVVAVPDEPSLIALASRAGAADIVRHVVHEPDVNYEATALALEPGDAARRLCSSLPLALREVRAPAA